MKLCFCIFSVLFTCLVSTLKGQTISNDSLTIDSTHVPLLEVGPILPRSAPIQHIHNANIIPSRYVELAYNKTMSIIFPSAIQSVDLGSREIIADKATNVENVLKIKSTKIGFNETNFSVITADGKFWSFIANYNEAPMVIALNLATDQLVFNEATRTVNTDNPDEGIIEFFKVHTTQQEVVYNCNAVLNARRSTRHIGVSKGRIDATVHGFFIKDNVYYVKFVMENHSNVHYDIDFVRFFIVDKVVAKRTSMQEIEIKPLYIYNDVIKTVRGKTKVERIYAFQKFTIPDAKELLVQIGEINGGRNLEFTMRNDDIYNADTL